MERGKEIVRPPVYEFWIETVILYIIFGLCLSYLICLVSHELRDWTPIFVLCIAQGLFALFLINKYSESKTKDIPSKCYHPDLLPQQEYLDLRRKYVEAERSLFRIKTLSDLTKEEREELRQSYAAIMNNISPILDVQENLRALCSFKMTFGYIETPAIYALKEIKEEEKKTKKEDENNTRHVPGSFIDSNTSNKSFDATNSFDEIAESECSPFEPLEILLSEQLHESTVSDDDLKIADLETMLKNYKNLKTQFAAMKAENEVLKESIEKILESKPVF